MPFSISNHSSLVIIRACQMEIFSQCPHHYEAYLEKSQTENLILRYTDLVRFIIASKKQKLDELQAIIGFTEVGNLRDLLKKNAGRYKRTINAENFNNKKGSQQSIILQNFGAKYPFG